jgi:hypothetical protein
MASDMLFSESTCRAPPSVARIVTLVRRLCGIWFKAGEATLARSDVPHFVALQMPGSTRQGHFAFDNATHGLSPSEPA